MSSEVTLLLERFVAILTMKLGNFITFVSSMIVNTPGVFIFLITSVAAIPHFVEIVDYFVEDFTYNRNK